MTDSRTGASIVLLAVLGLFGAARSPGAVQVQSEHPRLYFNNANRQALTAQAKRHPHWNVVRKAAGQGYHLKNPEGAYNARAGALVALVESDAKLARKVIDYLLTYKQKPSMRDLSVGRMNRAVGHAYDWIYNFMNPEQRAQCAANLIAAAKLGKKIYYRDKWSAVNNHGCQQVTANVVVALATWEHGGREELWPWAYKEFTEKYILSQKIMGPYGGWFEGNSAYIEGFLVNCYHAMDALRSAAGIDYYKTMPDVIRGSGYFAGHAISPDGFIVPWADSTHGRLTWKCWWAMAKGARESRDPALQWIAKHWQHRGSSNSGWTTTSILMYDPSLPARRPARLGYTSGQRPDGIGMGYVFMRTGWSEGAVHIGFRCGDYFGHHNHADSNAFTIHWKGVQVAMDEGYQKGLPWKDSSHHNTLSIAGCRGKGGEGSQRYYHTSEPMSPQEVLQRRTRYEMGDLVAYEETDQYIYACGDAGAAYRPKVRFFRHILLVKPDLLIVDDQVDRANTWNMQTACDATVDGQIARLTGPRGVQVTMRVLKGGPVRLEGKWVRFDSVGGENLVAIRLGPGMPPVPDCRFNPNGPGGRFGSWTLAGRVKRPFDGGGSPAPTRAALPARRQTAAVRAGPRATEFAPVRPKPAAGVQPGPPAWTETYASALAAPERLMRERRFAAAARAYGDLEGKVAGEGAAQGVRARADAARAGERLWKAIIDGVRGGASLHVYVEIAGRKTRARVVRATPETLVASALGQQLDVPWSGLSDAGFCRLAARCAGESARAQLDLVRFCVYADLPAQARTAAQSLAQADAGLAREARKLLGQSARD